MGALRLRRFRLARFAPAIALTAAVCGPVACTGDNGGDASDAGREASADVNRVDATDIQMADVTDVQVGIDAVDVTDVTDVTDVVGPVDAAAPHMARLIVNCDTVCTSPQDAVLTSDGTTVYFLAFTLAGDGAVFQVNAAGGAGVVPTLVVGGFDYPTGLAISSDDMTLYVADMTATRGATGVGVGSIFSVSATGHTKTEIPVTGMLQSPAGIAVSPDGATLFISARAGDGMPGGVFSVSTAGGAATAVAMGAAVSDPSGISVTAMGDLRVQDVTAGGPTASLVLSVHATTVTAGTLSLRTNFPSGIALGFDDQSLLISGSPIGMSGVGLLTWVASDGTVMALPALSMGMVSPNGLHRARVANVFVVADDEAGTNSHGAIFAVTP